MIASISMLSESHKLNREFSITGGQSRHHHTVAHKYHGKTFFLTAKLSFSRQNFLSHCKTFFLTAKLSFSRQNSLSHGKTFFLTAKLSFLTAKLSFSRQNSLSHGKALFCRVEHSL